MTSILVTHADAPIGQRAVTSFCRNADVDMLIAVGDGPPPRRFERYLHGEHPRLLYKRVDLTRHRSVTDLFHSEAVRNARIDTVVHIPSHGAVKSETAPGAVGLPRRVAETRMILQNCLRTTSVESVVALSSAYVYRLPPGNANRLDENSELDMDPYVEPNIRAWIDSDMMFHGEVHSDLLRVVLLRVPTVVATGGYVYFNPALCGRRRPRSPALGFDPICALVSDRDVARAVSAAVRSDRSGVFNISGTEAVPLSALTRSTRRFTPPESSLRPQWLRRAIRLLPEKPDLRMSQDSRLRYGFTLDTRAAERELGFRATDLICLDRGGDGALSLEAVPA